MNHINEEASRLKLYSNRFKDDIEAKANELIKLHSERKIGNVKTVEKILINLTLDKKENKFNKAYDKLKNKYQDAEPARNTRRVKKTVIKQDVEIQAILYTEPSEDAFDDKKKHKRGYKHKALHQVYYGSIKLDNFELIDEDRKLLEKHNKKLITVSKLVLGRRPTPEEELEFVNVALILANNQEMKNYIFELKKGYVVGILILNYKIQDKPVEEYNPRTTRLRDATTKQSINYKYIHTELNLTKDTFEEAITNNNYVKDECWINTLYDIYKDNLLSPYKNQRYRITREVILSTINKTEDNIKDGLTIDDILPFFVKYKLRLRVFDMFYKLIFRYDPPVSNRNNSPLYCMIKGDHVYTLNNDLKMLEQKINEEGLDKEFHLKVSSNYRVDERDDITYFMIENVDDILKYLNIEDEKIYFIHKTDDLMYLLFNLIELKYEPKIKLECGRLTWIFLVLNNKQIYIKTQMLITSSIDGKIELDDPDTYNRMLSINNKFNNNLFKKSHKSFYTKLDIDILDEYRTSANVGMLSEINNDDNMIELDISKAFTSAFLKIKTIPIFNEFDQFIPYDNSDIEDYNLYVVQPSVNDLFLNKTYNLCYGLFLKQLKNVNIISYKEPSNLKEVNYDKIIEELYNDHISDDKDIDIYIKKLIGNVNFGLLEKSYNKCVDSHIYDSLEEATLFQSKLGGVIHTLQQYVEEECNEYLCPDWMRELDNHLTDDQYEEQKQMNMSKIKYIEKGKPLYVLNLTAKKLLVNGFRYIKELLMQHHNFLLMNLIIN